MSIVSEDIISMIPNTIENKIIINTLISDGRLINMKHLSSEHVYNTIYQFKNEDIIIVISKLHISYANSIAECNTFRRSKKEIRQSQKSDIGLYSTVLNVEVNKEYKALLTLYKYYLKRYDDIYEDDRAIDIFEKKIKEAEKLCNELVNHNKERK